MRKLEVCTTTYTQSITSEEYNIITARDGENNCHDQDLAGLIDKIEGVDDCDYNGHFGMKIFYRVEKQHDTPTLHSKIGKMINKYAINGND